MIKKQYGNNRDTTEEMDKNTTYGDRKIHKHPNANTAGFDANPENINRKGRPRRLVSGVIAELEKKGVERVSQSNVKDAFLMLINLEINEVEDIVNDKSQPALVRIVGREMLSGKGFEIIEKMLDRAIGKSEDNISIKSESKVTATINTLDDWYNANRSNKKNDSRQ